MSTPAVYVPPSVTPHPAPAADAPARVRLDEILALIRRRRLLILGVASAFIAATLAVLLLMPPRYVANATVVLEGRKNNVADQSAVLSSLPTDPASLQNQIGILMSRDLAVRVVNKLKLYTDDEFRPSTGLFGSDLINSPTALERQRNATVDTFLNHLSVDVLGLSSSLSIRFSSTDPDKAARITNAIVDAYIAGQISAKVDAANTATGWLNARIRQLAAQVEDAEGAVQRYKIAHNLSDGPDGTALVDQQMLAINTQLVQARADLAQKEANFARAKSLLASGHASEASQVVASPVIVQLRQQEADLARQEAQLATRYGPRHPKMIEIESQRRDFEAKIDEEVHRITGSLESEVEAAKTQVASLQASLAQAQKESSSDAGVRIELKSLEANAQSTRTMYESFVTRLRETQDQTAMQMPDARVVSRASAPVSPAPPRRALLFAASIPASLLLGFLIALIIERFNAPATAAARRETFDGFRDFDQVALPKPAIGKLPVLAEFPDLSKISSVKMPAADYVIDYPASGFARAIAALERQIATDRWEAPKVIVVTCGDRGTAHTAIALSLARAASQRGQRVLLIDAAGRSPAALPLARAKRPRGGLAEVVGGSTQLSNSVARDSRSNVMLLPWLARPAKMRDLLDSLRMRKLIAYLRGSCDLVIIDTPPVSSPETAALVSYADAVLLVGALGEKGQTGVERGVAKLETLNAPVVGIALAA